MNIHGSVKPLKTWEKQCENNLILLRNLKIILLNPDFRKKKQIQTENEGIL